MRWNYADQKQKKGGGVESDYTDEAQALLSHLKPLMNLYRVLVRGPRSGGRGDPLCNFLNRRDKKKEKVGKGE